MSAPEELEAAIWQAMTTYRITCPDPARFVAALAVAVLAWAEHDPHDGPLSVAVRRRLLHMETARVPL